MENDLKYENVSEQMPVETPPQTSPSPEKKKRWTSLRIIALGLSCAIIGGAMGVGGMFLGNAYQQNLQTESQKASTMVEGVRESTVLNVAQIDTSRLMTASEVYAANVNSTVGITTSVTTNFWGYQTTSAASGSGFILTDDGYVLTNYHVIEASDEITVSLYNGESYVAELIGYDESNDVAVLKIEAENLTPVVLGDSDHLNIGDSVVAIGNPLGELTFSLTAGAVSALDREITLSNNTTMNLIQTDCAINSGNSGGALFNLYGEVIGITNAKYSGSGSEASIDNIGFAIPINQVKSIVQSIIENGYIVKPYIGVSVTDVSAEMQSYGLPGGAAVKEIIADSPAAAAGLQENDIITFVNGVQISSRSDLVNAVSEAAAGAVLKLSVYRQGKTIEIEVEVGELKQSALASEETRQDSQQPADRQSQSQPNNWDLPQRFGAYYNY